MYRRYPKKHGRTFKYHLYKKYDAGRSAKRAVYSMAMEDVYLRKSTCRMLVRLLAKDPENEELEAKLYTGSHMSFANYWYELY